MLQRSKQDYHRSGSMRWKPLRGAVVQNSMKEKDEHIDERPTSLGDFAGSFAR